jgi:hypothetical protein
MRVFIVTHAAGECRAGGRGHRRCRASLLLFVPFGGAGLRSGPSCSAGRIVSAMPMRTRAGTETSPSRRPCLYTLFGLRVVRRRRGRGHRRCRASLLLFVPFGGAGLRSGPSCSARRIVSAMPMRNRAGTETSPSRRLDRRPHGKRRTTTQTPRDESYSLCRCGIGLGRRPAPPDDWTDGLTANDERPRKGNYSPCGIRCVVGGGSRQ